MNLNNNNTAPITSFNPKQSSQLKANLGFDNGIDLDSILTSKERNLKNRRSFEFDFAHADDVDGIATTLIERFQELDRLKLVADRANGGKSRKASPVKLKRTMKAFVGNLYIAFERSTKNALHAVKLPLGSDHYKGKSVGLDFVKRVMEFLIHDKWMMITVGHYDSITGEGEMTRIAPAPLLFAQFDTVAKTTEHLIRMKDPAFKDSGSKTKIKTLQSRSPELDAIFTQNGDIEKIIMINGVRRKTSVTRDGVTIPMHDIYRVLSNDSIECGGRLYGCAVQWKPQHERGRAMIEGEPTVELDFSELHPSMLYHHIGTTYFKPPYSIDGFPRNLVKMAFNMMLNSETRKIAHQAIQKEINFSEGEFGPETNISDLIDAICRDHSPVLSDFNNSDDRKWGIGLDLQRLDSDIAIGVIHHFAQQGILCIGIHDSFIVAERYKDELHTTMTEQYNKVIGRTYMEHTDKPAMTLSPRIK